MSCCPIEIRRSGDSAAVCEIAPISSGLRDARTRPGEEWRVGGADPIAAGLILRENGPVGLLPPRMPGMGSPRACRYLGVAGHPLRCEHQG